MQFVTKFHMHMCPSCVFGYCRDTEIRLLAGKNGPRSGPRRAAWGCPAGTARGRAAYDAGDESGCWGLEASNQLLLLLSRSHSLVPPPRMGHTLRSGYAWTRRSTAVFPVRKLVRRKHLRAASFHLRKLRSKKKKSSPFMKSAKRQWIWHPGIGKKGNLPQICDR